MKSFEIDDSSITEVYPPIISAEDEMTIKKLFEEHPELNYQAPRKINYTVGSDQFDPNEPWFNTFSGKRFTPLNPNPDSIVIQDIARALSMQCRFTGHVKRFYSVSQHSVLVSYLCDWNDRLWGLLHDASEAYISDLNRPVKHSGYFENYITLEKKIMDSICKRFEMNNEEPASVHRADKLILATEGRDILFNKREDWMNDFHPLPFDIIPWSPEKAEAMFLNRFNELIYERQTQNT
jgi:5'-deoxynucleotidase YfbR-like HD superfamily hydrolase